MAEDIDLKFVSEQLKRLIEEGRDERTERAQQRERMGEIEKATAATASVIAGVSMTLASIGSRIGLMERRLDRLQDGIDLANGHLTRIVTSFEARLAKLEQA